MNNILELKVSGYRGVWGESLNEDIARNYARAFGEFVKEQCTPRTDLGNYQGRSLVKDKPKILIGRDGRESGQTIANAIIPALKEMGINVIYGDILPTPTMMFSIKHQNYDGGIIITASHNPIKYNGLKFVVRGGRMTNEEEVEKIKKSFAAQDSQNFSRFTLSGGGSLPRRQAGDTVKNFDNPVSLDSNNQPNFIKNHIDFVLENIDVEKIRARKFKVGVDMINASACVVDPYLFEKLGIEFIAINNIPDGKFAHIPEPLKENLGGLEKLVIEEKCDIGFAQDPDADRLVLVDENGNCISEEYTLAFGIENILSKNPKSAIAINMSTSQMIADIAEKYDSICLRTKVGESNVFSGMKKVNAVAGGEGGGGVIYPTLNNCRDSFVSIALTLELLAERGQTVSRLVNSLPKYFIKKDKESIEGKNLEEMYTKLKNHFLNSKINEEDGLKLEFSDKSWIHLRPSNTEPIIRLFGEAKTQDRIDALFAETKNILM